jgi:hypothetical protein
MLVLFETPAGFALFKVLDESKLKKLDKLWENFQDVNKAQKMYVSSRTSVVQLHQNSEPSQ